MTLEQVYMSSFAFYSLFLSSVEFQSENRGRPQLLIIFLPLVIIICLNGLYLHCMKIKLCKQFLVLFKKLSFGQKMGDFQKPNFTENTKIYCYLKLQKFPYMVGINAIFINTIFLIKRTLLHFKTKILDVLSFLVVIVYFKIVFLWEIVQCRILSSKYGFAITERKNLIVSMSVRSQAAKNSNSGSGLNSRKNEQYRNISKNRIFFIPFSEWLGLQGKKSQKMRTQDKISDCCLIQSFNVSVPYVVQKVTFWTL